MTSLADTITLRAADLNDISEYDAACFGDDRGRLLKSLMGVALGAYCVRTGDTIEGYTMVLPSAVGVRIGPCAADTPSAIEKLVTSVLADFPKSDVVVGVPIVNAHAMGFLESTGFSRTPSCLHMLRGTPIAGSSPGKLVAIANGALG